MATLLMASRDPEALVTYQALLAKARAETEVGFETARSLLAHIRKHKVRSVLYRPIFRFAPRLSCARWAWTSCCGSSRGLATKVRCAPVARAAVWQVMEQVVLAAVEIGDLETAKVHWSVR